MKATLLAYLLVLGAKLYAQNFEWVTTFGGASSDAGRSTCFDDLGNLYTTGNFAGTVDFDPGAGTTDLTCVGVDDIFVQKMDTSGNFLWAKSFGGTSSDLGYSIAADAAGNVYTIGYFQGTVDFDPGAGTYSLTSSGVKDIFIQKLDAFGNFLWAEHMGGTSDDMGYSISVDASGNIYTTGSFWGTVDFDPGAGIANLVSWGNGDIFIQKLDASGNFLWAKNIGGGSTDVGYSICLDAAGNIYTTGAFGGTVDFDSGVGTTNLTSGGWEDIFIQKLNASGNFLWARSMPGSAFDQGRSITVDASGNVYTIGYFQGTVDFDPGAGTYSLTSSGVKDIFVQKLDASGNFLWAGHMGGTSDDIGYSISVDASGNIYTAGSFRGTADFDPGVDTFYLPSGGSNDIFIQKLDASGNLIWALNFGGGVDDAGFSINVDNSGNIFTTGYFKETSDFDPGSGLNSCAAVGQSDIFVHKMSPSISNIGLLETRDEIQITTFPNPSNSAVRISLNQPLKDVELILTDYTGKVISKQFYSSLINLTIELPEPNGLYFLTIIAKETQATIKLIKD